MDGSPDRPQPDPRPVCVIVEARARPDQVQRTRRALMAIADPIRANPDTLDFRVYQSRSDPQAFRLWERWVSEAALFAHGSREYMAEYNAIGDEIYESLDADLYEEVHRVDVAPSSIEPA